MNIQELKKKLSGLGITIPPSTLRNWQSEGLISANSKGKGSKVDWPESVIPTIAGIYAVRRDSEGRVKRISVSDLKKVRDFANNFFATLERYRNNTDDPRLLDFYETIYTDVDFKEPITLPDGSIARFRLLFLSEELHPLVMTWIATVEKLLLGIPVTTPAAITYYLCRRAKGRDAYENAFIPKEYFLATAQLATTDLVQIATLPDCATLRDKLDAIFDTLVGVKTEEGWRAT